MSTIIWVSSLEVESKIHKIICDKLNIESFQFSFLSEITEFIINDIKPSILIIDEKNYLNHSSKFSELFSNSNIKKVLMTSSEIEKPSSISNIFKMPINVQEYKDFLLKLSV